MKLTNRIENKLLESFVYSRGDVSVYFGKSGRYVWNVKTGVVSYFSYSIDYHGKDNPIGKLYLKEYK